MSDLLLTDSPQIQANEMLLCKGVAETLHKHYPGYLWGVAINQGIVDIRCLNLSGTWGYTLHLPKSYSASDWDRQVLRAGGEILERYRQRRGQHNPQDVLAAKRDFAQRLVFDR